MKKTKQYYGYAVGIDGEILLGLGRAEKEALHDAQQNSGEILERRGADVGIYAIADQMRYEAIETEGDGYEGNNLSGFGQLLGSVATDVPRKKRYLLIDDLGRLVGRIESKTKLTPGYIEYGGTRDGVKDVEGRAKIVPLSHYRKLSTDEWSRLKAFDADGYFLSH